MIHVFRRLSRFWIGCATGVTVLAVTIVASGAGGTAAAAAATPQGQGQGLHWVASWGASPSPATPAGLLPGDISAAGFTNQTIRDIVFTSVGGSPARVTISNSFGAAPLRVGQVDVAVAGPGATLVPGTTHVLTFGGRRGVTIRPGEQARSDPARMAVPRLTNLAISIYLPTATGPATYHQDAQQTNYVSTTGNFAGQQDGSAFTTTASSWFFAAALDVAGAPAGPRVRGTVVAFGDSITDGFQSTQNANARWPNDLARRLLGGPPGHALGVIDEGISGNRLLHDSPCLGVNALARLNRDALTQAGAKDVILLEGINDIGFSNLPNSGCAAPNTAVSAAQIIAAYQQIIHRAHAAGLKIFGGTLTPFKGSFYWSAAAEAKREAVNHWIQTSRAFDGVIDFAAAVASPSAPLVMNPAFDSGDHLHPNDAGYQAMADTVKIAMLG
jgi:lysophospholipase L1-like esterase